jgi:hypothetical protein
VLLATCREIVERFVSESAPGASLWIGGSVLNPDEISDLRSKGFLVTVFAHPITTIEDIEDAKQTIIEHHPGEQVWVDMFPDLTAKS